MDWAMTAPPADGLLTVRVGQGWGTANTVELALIKPTSCVRQQGMRTAKNGHCKAWHGHCSDDRLTPRSGDETARGAKSQ